MASAEISVRDNISRDKFLSILHWDIGNSNRADVGYTQVKILQSEKLIIIKLFQLIN